MLGESSGENFMDRLLFKKINLLIHLATVDGHFHDSEKELLRTLLAENGLKQSYLEEHTAEPVLFESLNAMPDKDELLYWVLKLIHADQLLHPKELTFANSVAGHLGYKTEVIEFYRHHSLQSLSEFKKEVNAFKTQTV